MTFEQMLIAYRHIYEVAQGEYPMDTDWAVEWLNSLDANLHARLESARTAPPSVFGDAFAMPIDEVLRRYGIDFT